MSQVPRSLRMSAAAVLALAGVAAAVGHPLAPTLSAPDVRPGLLVVLDPQATDVPTELRLDGKFTVQSLVRDSARCDAARAAVYAAGVYGAVSAGLHALSDLPYADDTVNALVAERFDALRTGGLGAGEIVRALAPYGCAWLGGTDRAAVEAELGAAGRGAVRVSASNGWVRIDKPYPPDMDAWGCATHDAEGSFLSRDRLAGPPRSVRWVAGEKAILGRHGSPEIAAAGGRIFFLQNAAGRKGCVEARDAFNGLLLWRTGPTGNVRLLLADADTLFVLTDDLEAWDAATGRTRLAFKTGPIMWPSLLLDAESGILVAGSAHARWIRAFDSRSGRALWKTEGGLRATWSAASTVIGKGKLYALCAARPPADTNGIVVVRLDLVTGAEEAVYADIVPAGDSTPVLAQYLDGKLIVTSSPPGDKQKRTASVLSATDGRVLWRTDTRAGLVGSRGGLLHAQGLFWRLNAGAPPEGLDPDTGDVRRTLPGKLTHVLCGPVLATDRYLLAARNHFVDWQTGALYNCAATRLACRKSGIVANGLTYYGRHPCACGYSMNGEIALSAAVQLPEEVEPPEAASRIGKGPAYADNAEMRRSEFPVPRSEDWPTYRANPLRGASVAASLPAALTTNWAVRIGGSASAPVVAGGRVLVAVPEEHRVVCLDAAGGRELWSFTAGARVDSPPTVVDGLAVFGCRDGNVYALRAADGAAAWTFRAAPVDRRIVVQEQVESLWPVFGAVLAERGRLYVSAGRHVDVDGGIWVYGLDPRTGSVVWSRNAINPLHQVEHAISASLRGEGGINDILRSDGTNAYVAGDFDKMAFDLVSGEKRAKVKGLPILSSPNDLLQPPALRIPAGAWGDPTDSSVTWVYHPAPGETGMFWGNYHSPERTGPRFDISQKWGYAADALAFDGLRVFGAGREQDPKRAKLAVFGKPAADAPLWFADPGDEAARLQGVILAGDQVVVALGGTYGEGEGRAVRGRILRFAAADGRKIDETPLPFVPRWDGMAVAGGRLFVAAEDGRLACFGE